MFRIRCMIFILACLGLGMLAADCRATSPLDAAPVRQALQPIRFGATVSLEGKYAGPSGMLRDGFKLWEKQVNERGGLLGRPVELVLHDDKSNPELVRELYTKLIAEDKVDMVLSPYGTPLTLAAAEVTTRYGYTMLACGASGDEIWNGRFKNVFGMYSPGKRYFIGLVDIMASNGLNSVAILYENSPFSRDAAEGAKEWAERFGLKVSLYRSYASGKTELPGLLRQARGENPDGLILVSYPEDSYLLLDLMKTEKYRPRVLAFTIASSYPDFYEKAGGIAEGVFGSSQWEPDERIPFPGTKRFIADFFKFTNRLPSYHSGSAYAGCQLMERAVRHCDCFDQARIADFIRSLDTVTVVGRFKVGLDGKQTGHNSIIIQWQNGKKEIVFPANMQTAPPRI
ncbi:MAG: amino acid ABC transporter substrate-binding protein [Syntrophobacteraceae bacterium]